MQLTCFDLETSNLNSDYGYIICCVIKRYVDPEINGKKHNLIKTFRIDQYPEHKKEPWNDKKLCLDIRDELNKYDILVGYNSVRFDIPYLNGRLLLHNLKLLDRKKHIDLFYKAKYCLKLHNNRLASVADFFQTSPKTQLAPTMWTRAQCGDKTGIDYVSNHCKQDVITLEEIYNILKPTISKIY